MNNKKYMKLCNLIIINDLDLFDQWLWFYPPILMENRKLRLRAKLHEIRNTCSKVKIFISKRLKNFLRYFFGKVHSLCLIAKN